jgi:DDE superfamily endonuclease
MSSHHDDELVEQLAVLQLILLCVGALYLLPERVVGRNTSLIEQRLAWNEYCSRHHQRGTLLRRLRMRKDSFDKLVLLLQEDLVVNEAAANKRGGAILPEICLYCTLRYLAGGSYLDITDIAGISQSSFYRVVWKTITAIVKCSDLRIVFPTTGEEVKAAIGGFASISTEGVIKNCAGVVDGYLLRIKVPTKEEVKNVRSFFSGHYQCYGVNIQAAADHNSRFIHFSFAAPGVTGDRDAIKQCSLFDLVESLPKGICVIGDAAYQPTEHMVPVYQGVDKLCVKYDNFNFFASQCRIRVEMAFGMMQSKWGILQRPLSCSLSNMLWLVQAIARLHNFCISERLAQQQPPFEVPDSLVPGYIPAVPHNDDGDPVCLGGAFVGTVDGHSFIREWMATRVEKEHLKRPGNSADGTRKRNREELELELDLEVMLESGTI